MADPLLEVIREIGVIHPGDTLILSTPDALTVEEAGRIKADVEDAVPGVNVVVVSGCKVMVRRDA